MLGRTGSKGQFHLAETVASIAALRTPPWLPSGWGCHGFLTIQRLLPIVGAGIATYFPLCDGMAHVA